MSGCTKLTTLDTRDTSVGIALPSGSVITTLQLGSPISFVANNLSTLGEQGTTYSIQSSANLDDLRLVNINQQSVKGFTVFDNIYGGS